MASCCSSNSAEGSACEGGGVGDWWRLGLGALVAGQSMVFGLAVNMSPPDARARWIIHGVLATAAVVVFLLVGLPVWREAWSGILRRRVVVEQFFLLGMFGAFAASVHSTLTGVGAVYYEVVAVLLAIYTLGSLIGKKRRQAALEMAESYQRQFAVATLRTCCGQEREVPVSEVEPGDMVVVRPGGGVPVDGRVVEGTGFVREAALTGEAFPVVKHPGDRVVSGSHSLDATLIIEATAGGGARALDRLVAAVREAQARPSALQREADRLVAWFLPLVLIVAAVTFVAWTLHSGWVVALFHALAVILIACPCAMGLATPIGIWSALGALASRGILCKSGDMIEGLAQCDTVVFDKTGTLSEEQLAVREVVVAEGVERSELQSEIAALQEHSIHPVARAFRSWVGAQATSCRLAGPLETLPGVGVRGVIRRDDGTTAVVAIGNAAILDGTAGADGLERRLLSHDSADRRFYVLLDGQPVAVAVLKETLREEVPLALERLRSAGLRVLVMTGDIGEHMRSLELGAVVEVYAGLSPEGKAEKVAELQAAGAKVCFIGDGINDSLAMAGAHAAIAITGGSELAVASSGAEMRGGSISELPEVFDVCRRVVKAIHGNLAFAACYNMVGVGMAAAGLLHPVVAALIMLVSSVTVTWRALRDADQIQQTGQDVISDQNQSDMVGGSAHSEELAPAIVSGGAR